MNSVIKTLFVTLLFSGNYITFSMLHSENTITTENHPLGDIQDVSLNNIDDIEIMQGDQNYIKISTSKKNHSLIELNQNNIALFLSFNGEKKDWGFPFSRKVEPRMKITLILKDLRGLTVNHSKVFLNNIVIKSPEDNKPSQFLLKLYEGNRVIITRLVVDHLRIEGSLTKSSWVIQDCDIQTQAVIQAESYGKYGRAIFGV